MKIYLNLKFCNQRILNLIDLFKLEHDPCSSIGLLANYNSLELYNRNNTKQKSIKVDFFSKKNNYRCLHYNKKNEILHKVAGIKKSYTPFILDLTAGLGNDAFIFSFLGCQVVMIERHPIVAVLLQDGLQRGYNNEKIGYWLKKRLHLIVNDSCKILESSLFKPDVIYLDPMYPICKKKCLPKKNMQILRYLIRHNDDCEKLLYMSRKIAKNRIIVKRPIYAEPLSKEKINFFIKTKNHRFDIYIPY
ncbi:16S rRNA methyltransferase [Buchnera aphidicola (Macrosiphoniella sanborni)]|uniref:Ribosomal RNA small subunit methyltransferase J n=1 Tax=Buchnera aphidicola (Macrosiphoniella sanborni) TaxID=1241865 RepID=A0A4D6YDT5_9GAMM|nr:class I SAM-dependent methyltransferase [Buchnera aphidicola]QCI24078.1 16S rRNA methyltransferase [Buchnera aphidicola (Macrosiphoniella sanborni)]